jgi:hypothetical protein
MIKPECLIRPEDQFREGFPTLGFREEYSFRTSGEPVLVTDPTYLADVYNSHDEEACYLRAHGVFVMDFGGDTSCPVWYKDPYLMLPISMPLTDDARPLQLPTGARVLADEVGTDSGSFIFLPLVSDLPSKLQAEVNAVLTRRTGATLALPAGHWTLFYQQWDPTKGYPASLYRDIVLKRE